MIAMNDTQSVPTTIGHTPKLAGSNSGAHRVVVKNSLIETTLKNSRVGFSSDNTINTVVTTESAARTPSTVLAMRSVFCRRRRAPVARRLTGAPLWGDVVAIDCEMIDQPSRTEASSVA